MYSRFREIYQARHEYAQSFAGKGVMGYICTLVPEEVAYAAGFLPVRLMGAHQTQAIADAYIPTIFCSYCRDVLAEGLQGKYHYRTFHSVRIESVILVFLSIWESMYITNIS